MPLVDVVASDGTLAPAQIAIDVPKLNVGVNIGFTVTTKFAESAHCPASGVNVYVPELALSTEAGLHVPVIPFCDVAGNEGTAPPLQILKDVPKAKVGVMLGATVTVNEIELAHCPLVGVKVYVPEF